jgi:Holliday junction resolvase RusA-like endonuclease
VRVVLPPVTLVVPVEPVAKARPRVVRDKRGNTRTYTPEATAGAEDTIAKHWIAVYGGRVRWPRPIALAVGVTAYLARPGGSKRRFPTVRPDADNYLKMVDALNGLAWDDDAQAVDMNCQKRYDGQPRWEIRIAPIEWLEGA